VLLAQARLAARNGVSLDTVLRHYFAGYTLLGDFLTQEAGDGDLLRGATFQDVMRAQAILFDRLVADEYRREEVGRLDSAEQRRTERIQRLLSGWRLTHQQAKAAMAVALRSPKSRRTVSNHLRMIEARLGRPLSAAMMEIEVALQLQELDAISSSAGSAHQER